MSEAKGALEVTKRGYSEEEITSIYELGRLLIENGSLKQAESIFQGLIEVAPEFVPGWLGLAYLHIHQNNSETGLITAQQAVRLDAESCEAMLFLVICLLSTGDYQSAGSYLGEIGDRVESGSIDNPNVIRLFRAQMARYEHR